MNPLLEQPALVILAGGKGSRLGGELKPALEYRGKSLLASTLAAVRSVAGVHLPTVVVGAAERLRPLLDGHPGATEIRWTREEPAFAGPVAGLQAALELVSQRWLVLLASDLPDPEAGLAALFGAATGADGTLLVDASGRDQLLFGRYRVAALRAALQRSTAGSQTPRAKGPSLRAVIASLELARVSAPERALDDIDDWADAARWGITKGTP